MRNIVLTLFAASLALLARAGSVPERTLFTPDEIAPVSFPFRPVKVNLTPGERLEFEARWMGFPVGSLVLEVRWDEEMDKRKVHNIRAAITFNSLLSPFYKVNNEAVSILDAGEGFSRHFILKKREGRVSYDEDVEFDYRNFTARYTRRQTLPGRLTNRFSVQLPGKVCDPLSFLYYLRGVSLKPGEDVHIPVHTSQRNWAMTVRVLKRTEVTVPRGTFTVLKIEPVAQFPGLIERRGRMYAYLEEKTRLPVLMNVDIPIGNVSFRLVRTENSPLDEPPGRTGDGAVSAAQSGSQRNSRAGRTVNR